MTRTIPLVTRRSSTRGRPWERGKYGLMRSSQDSLSQDWSDMGRSSCPLGSCHAWSGILNAGNDRYTETLPLQQDLVEKIGAIAVNETDLSNVYRDYIACLNNQDWPKLGQFVHDEVIHNGRRVGLSGYCEMLERDFD